MCAHVLETGNEVIEASSAEQGMILAQSRQPSVVLIHHDLIDEEGAELCARLRAQPQTSSIPILMIVPDIAAIVASAYEAGAEDVLKQPYIRQELHRRLLLLIRLTRESLRAAAAEKSARQLFHDSRAVMLMIDPLSGRIVDANRAACSFYGYRHDVLTQMVLSDLDAQVTANDFALKTTNLVLRHQLASGEVRDVTMYSGPVDVNGRKHICMIIYDVTKRKIAEAGEQTQRSLAETLRETAEQLERERAQLQGILDSMQDGVMYAEVNGDSHNQITIRYVNRALEKLTGYAQEEWLAHGLSLLHMPNSPVEQYETILDEAWLHINRRGVWKNELQIPRRDGSLFTASVSIVRLQNGDGEIFGVVGVIRDISQERALADEKSRFVAHASHELRTPLTNAKTRVYLIRKQPERMEMHLDVLEDVIDRMRRLVETLLDLTKLGNGRAQMQFREIDLRQLARDVIAVQAPEADQKGLALYFDIPDTPLFVLADHEQLTQVLINLVTNAINYTPHGGTVTFRACIREADRGEGRYAVIEIEDTGVGIAAENLTNIFQPFFRVTSHVQGTGLGLSIAREIMNLHGGEITVHSTLGQGSIFTLQLPLVTRVTASTEA
jgi:PAS domain S-box-containing protein